MGTSLPQVTGKTSQVGDAATRVVALLGRAALAGCRARHAHGATWAFLGGVWRNRSRPYGALPSVGKWPVAYRVGARTCNDVRRNLPIHDIDTFGRVHKPRPAQHSQPRLAGLSGRRPYLPLRTMDSVYLSLQVKCLSHNELELLVSK